MAAYGKLTPEMVTLLASIVQGKVVYDVGAGDFTLTTLIARLGAARVCGIEPGMPQVLPELPSNVLQYRGYLHEWRTPADLDVLFVSWPVNRPVVGLVEWTAAADVVVYVGSNFDGLACGDRPFFGQMLMRDLVAYIPDRHNSMVVVSGHRTSPRQGTPEELAAFSDNIVHFHL